MTAQNASVDHIPSDQIIKKEKVGHLDGEDVWQLAYKGGLNAVALQKRSGRVETLALGSHRAIARHIAKKARPGIVWTGLAKSENYPYESYAKLLPKWEAVSEAVRARQGI